MQFTEFMRDFLFQEYLNINFVFTRDAGLNTCVPFSKISIVVFYFVSSLANTNSTLSPISSTTSFIAAAVTLPPSAPT